MPEDLCRNISKGVIENTVDKHLDTSFSWGGHKEARQMYSAEGAIGVDSAREETSITTTHQLHSFHTSSPTPSYFSLEKLLSLISGEQSSPSHVASS